MADDWSMDQSFWDQAYRDNPSEVIIPDQIIHHHTAGMKPGTALDLGCGTGEILLALGQKGWQGLGVDWSGYAVQLANQSAEMDGLNVRFEEGDITKWQTDTQYDLVISTYALPGGAANEPTLATAIKALKPGGTLLLAEWDVSMAEIWKMDPAELITVDQLIGWLPALEIEAARVLSLPPRTEEEASAGKQGKVAFVRAKKKERGVGSGE
jgi:2-polyprenyl-3-methyl-5-hydroxy-6-metoxy-1,4-benzoquinol methylase